LIVFCTLIAKTCWKCRASWCWLCGELIDSDHYDETSLACGGGQFAPSADFAIWSFLDQLLGEVAAGNEDNEEPRVEKSPCSQCCAKVVTCLLRSTLGGMKAVQRVCTLLESSIYFVYVSLGALIAGTCAGAVFIAQFPLALLVHTVIVYLVDQNFMSEPIIYLGLPAVVGGAIIGCGMLAVQLVWLGLALANIVFWPLIFSPATMRSFSKDSFLTYFCRPCLVMKNIAKVLKRFGKYVKRKLYCC
jgi:hypothetical protein